MKMKKPKGTSDIFGKEAYKWQFLENEIRQACKNFGIQEIRTPIFEYRTLFERGVGETTDVVQKEMFTFKDRGEREYALKPESTAGTVRAYLENGLNGDVQPTKLYYIAPSFRDERNQAGRFKQFHQFGVEMFGSFDASCDAEVISFVYELLKRLKIKDVTLKLNSLGGNECRKAYNEKLKSFLKTKIDYLCEDCKQRYEKNPLRVLDCKNTNCKEALKDAPNTIDSLDTECKNHFESLKKYLDIMNIPYEIDTKIVRGLDYYTKTVFEFVCKSERLGSQSTICGGGRYDNLIKECGGQATGAVGFGMGMERVLMLMEEQGLQIEEENRPLIYIGSMGDEGFIKAQQISYSLRQKGIYVEYDIVKRSVKAQLKYADKINAKYVIIIGDNEIETDKVNLKDMDKSEQREIFLSSLEKEIL
mgnify:CR=1 FL=1